MNKNDIKLVIIGFGAIAAKHLEVFRALDVQVTAACNRSAAGQQKARDAGIEKTYTDPLEIIEKEKPDGIILCASVLSIYTIAVRIIPFGIPILMEKPPGTSLEEAQHLARLADEHKTPVMVGLNRRFYSIYHKALDLIGGRSAITGVSVEWSENPEQMLKLGHPPELIPKLNFANSLHGIDLLTFFAGPIQNPNIIGRNLDPTGEKYRWQMALQGISDSGVLAIFTSNWDVPGRWRLLTDALGIRFVSAPLETGQLLVKGKTAQDLQPSDEDSQFKPGFYRQAQHFIEVVKCEKEVVWPANSLNDVLHTMFLAQSLTDQCLVRI